MELKDHLISKNVGKKFINSNTKKYEIGFKSGDLGYENKGILKRINGMEEVEIVNEEILKIIS